MHIGIDASRTAVATKTGTEHYTYELLAALAKRDRTTRYTLYCNTFPASLPPLGTNFALRHIPFPRLWTHARLSAELLAHPPNVLFVPAHVVPIGMPLQRHTNAVVTVHDMGYLHVPEAHTAAHRLYLRLSTAWSAQVARQVIAISQATRNDLVRYAAIPAEKITVIHHGVAKRFQPAAPQTVAETLSHYAITAPYLLFIGTVQPRKNLERVIEAFAHIDSGWWAADGSENSTVHPPPPTAHLVIAGKKGWLSDAIEQKAAALGIAERVRFIGYVPDQDVPPLLSGALGFVFPSLYEGFGMPVLEAMACGAPVITANTSSLPEVAGDAALLVDPHDTHAIANAMRRLLAEPELRAELAERGKTRAAQFTWDACAAATLKVLEHANQHKKRRVS